MIESFMSPAPILPFEEVLIKKYIIKFTRLNSHAFESLGTNSIKSKISSKFPIR